MGEQNLYQRHLFLEHSLCTIHAPLTQLGGLDRRTDVYSKIWWQVERRNNLSIRLCQLL